VPDTTTWTPLLHAIVGSTAYGLATPDSDVDRIHIAVAPTAEFHGLTPPSGKAATRVSTDPDIATHEVGKYIALILGCNPTLLELLWLDPDFHECASPAAAVLIENRGRFLHQHAVRSAFLGYAQQQLQRLAQRGDGSFSSDTRLRSHKHARHLWRLVKQGSDLFRTGTMRVHLTPAEAGECVEFADAVITNPAVGERHLAAAADVFDRATSPLPEQPDRAWAEAWLRGLRAEQFVAVAR
jgi:hypothetical protein